MRLLPFSLRGINVVAAKRLSRPSPPAPRHRAEPRGVLEEGDGRGDDRRGHDGPLERARGGLCDGSPGHGAAHPGARRDRGFVHIPVVTDPSSPQSVDVSTCVRDGVTSNRPFGHPRPAWGAGALGFGAVVVG